MHNTPQKRSSVWLCIAAFVVYAISFALPVYDSGDHLMSGFEAFFLAFAGCLGCMPFWLPNPLFWFGVFYFARKRYGRAFTCALLALLLGLTPLYVFLGGPGPAWQKGDAFLIWLTSFFGYHAWMASFVLLAIASLCARRTAADGGKEAGASLA